MGVANYGQMTAGGWMYIDAQGIVVVRSIRCSTLVVSSYISRVVAT